MPKCSSLPCEYFSKYYADYENIGLDIGDVLRYCCVCEIKEKELIVCLR